MKSFMTLCLLSLVGFNLALPTQNLIAGFGFNFADCHGLAEELDEFGKLFSPDKASELYEEYLQNDKQFQEVIGYMAENPFAYYVIALQPEIEELQHWINRNWICAEDEDAPSKLNSATLQARALARVSITGTFNGFLKDLFALAPSKEIRALLDKKIAEGGLIAKLWEKLVALKPAYERILKDNDFKKFLKGMTELGVDLKPIDNAIRRNFNW